jgi:hypothetical protein
VDRGMPVHRPVVRQFPIGGADHDGMGQDEQAGEARQILGAARRRSSSVKACAAAVTTSHICGVRTYRSAAAR